MSVQTIDAKMLQKMFLAGAKGLEAKKEYINELNVFPVPDGDTGTNMTMTIMAAAKDVANWAKRFPVVHLEEQEEIPALSCPRSFAVLSKN